MTNHVWVVERADRGDGKWETLINQIYLRKQWAKLYVSDNKDNPFFKFRVRKYVPEVK